MLHKNHYQDKGLITSIVSILYCHPSWQEKIRELDMILDSCLFCTERSRGSRRDLDHWIRIFIKDLLAIGSGLVIKVFEILCGDTCEMY